MKFKPEHPNLPVEYAKVHPETLGLMSFLESVCTRLGFAEPMATHIFRTKEQQLKFYLKTYLNKGLSPEAATKAAMARFTWHFVYCGIDLRDWVWTDAQVQRILVLAKERVSNESNKWEILYHDVGQGKHLHFAYKDAAWKAREEEFRNAYSIAVS